MTDPIRLYINMNIYMYMICVPRMPMIPLTLHSLYGILARILLCHESNTPLNAMYNRYIYKWSLTVHVRGATIYVALILERLNRNG